MSATPSSGRRRRGRSPTRRDPDDRDDTFDGAAFADLVDELPDEGFDLRSELRHMEIANSSNAYSQRRSG